MEILAQLVFLFVDGVSGSVKLCIGSRFGRAFMYSNSLFLRELFLS